jgi:hypothetical protein
MWDTLHRCLEAIVANRPRSVRRAAVGQTTGAWAGAWAGAGAEIAHSFGHDRNPALRPLHGIRTGDALFDLTEPSKLRRQGEPQVRPRDLSARSDERL